MGNNELLTNSDFQKCPKEILQIGHWGNARVYRLQKDNNFWTVKDFSQAYPIVKNWGRLTLLHERSVIESLDGIGGVPKNAVMVTPYTLAFEYIKGTNINLAPKELIDEEYLLKCEELLKRVHERGVVHLDTRGKSNWLVQQNGDPALIDYQSAVSTKYLPKVVRKMLEDIDISGVYKKWQEFQPDKMDTFRIEEKKRIDKIRKWWIFKGYLGLQKKGIKYIAPAFEEIQKKDN